MKDRDYYAVLACAIIIILCFTTCEVQGSQLSWATQLTNSGWYVSRTAPDIAHWTRGGEGSWPLSTEYVKVRMEFIIPVEMAGTLVPEPEFDMLIDKDAVWGRIWWAPIATGGLEFPFGAEVDLLTGEETEVNHYNPQPGDWFMEVLK